MGTRMTTQISSSVSDGNTFAFATRKAAILREAALPHAPLVMPRQVIEAPFAGGRALHRLLVACAAGFGRTARGR
ncbi:hypothetical protein JT55_08715 [Rhodovulum sp. NI22]|nr:hypothetical protein JT55_08715 [Rhodovulum sp. NI22]